MKYTKIDLSTSGDATIVAAISNKKIKVITYLISSDADVKLIWKSGTTALTGPMACGAYSNIYNGNTDLMPAGLVGVLETNTGEALILNSSGAVGVGGHITYIEVAV